MLHSFFPRDISTDSGDDCASFVLALLTAIHLERLKARDLGWRGIRPCMTEGWAWTCRIAGSDVVIGLLFEGEHISEEEGCSGLTGLFSLFLFPPAHSPLLDTFPLTALEWALRDDYSAHIRNFTQHEHFRFPFNCGNLRIFLPLNGQGLGITLMAEARRRSALLDGLKAADTQGHEHWVIPPGALDSDIPAYRLLLPFFSVLVSSTALLLEKQACFFLSHAAIPRLSYTENGTTIILAGEHNTCLTLDARWGQLGEGEGRSVPAPLVVRNRHGSGKTKAVLHVLTGFLGSGKTTFLREWIEHLHGRERFIGVLQNEFGAVGLDAFLLRDDTMVEALDEGCVCCSLADSLRPGLQRLMNALPTREFVLETTGLANPMNVLEALDELQDLITPGLVITIMDACSMAEQHDPLQQQEQKGVRRTQVAGAQVLILNKIDLVPEAARTDLRARLHAINPSACILEASFGRIPFAELDQCMDTTEYFQLRPSTAPLLRPLSEITAQATHASEGFTSTVWELFRPLTRHEVKKLVHSSGASRVKGIVEIEGEGQFILQYVPGQIDLTAVSGQKAEKTFLVVIGQNIAPNCPLI